LRRKEVLASPLLQVGHHGSRTSTSWGFLAAVHPRLALVPTGLNPPFPFPHPQVLARLRENKVLPLVQKDGFGEVQVLSPREVAIFAPRPVFLHIGP
jgi:competence protein ComEC